MNLNEKIKEKMTPGICMLTGGVLMIAGIVWQLCSQKALDMYAFYMMAAAVFCLTSVIVPKLAKVPVNPMSYIVGHLVILIIGFAVTGSDQLTGMALFGFWAVCLIAAWIMNAFFLPCEGAAKRIMMGFVSMFLNVILIGIVFMIPVLIAAFFPRTSQV